MIPRANHITRSIQLPLSWHFRWLRGEAADFRSIGGVVDIELGTADGKGLAVGRKANQNSRPRQSKQADLRTGVQVIQSELWFNFLVVDIPSPRQNGQAAVVRTDDRVVAWILASLSPSDRGSCLRVPDPDRAVNGKCGDFAAIVCPCATPTFFDFLAVFKTPQSAPRFNVDL